MDKFLLVQNIRQATWLKADGGIDPVRAAVLAWLERHGREEAASFLNQAWLDAGAPPTPVRDIVCVWLETYPRSRFYRHVLQKWQKVGGRCN